jgi:hypothetical protein
MYVRIAQLISKPLQELKRRKIIFGQALLYELRGSELFNVKVTSLHTTSLRIPV